MIDNKTKTLTEIWWRLYLNLDVVFTHVDVTAYVNGHKHSVKDYD